MRWKLFGIVALLSVVLALTIVLALLVGGGSALGGSPLGAVDLSPRAMLEVLLWRMQGGTPEPAAAQLIILWRIRLPEILLAAVIGAALSVSGSVFQTTLRNPLADPLLLGVASGASLAASIAIGLGATGGLVPSIAATAGSGLTLVFVFAVAGRRGKFDPGTMVLAGVIASTLYSAITLFLLAVTPSQTISQILHWTMGGFADVGFEKVRWAGPALIVIVVASFAGARPLNLLLLGDDAAASAGLAVAPVRAALYALGALLTGISVAAAGVVGFVGLVVPHLSRLLFGADQRIALPASALLGAILCVVADAIARLAVPLAQTLWAWIHSMPPHVSPVELPVGVVTALFGAPFFLWLLSRRGGGS
jgi:iron complex transport system permease protein